MRDEGRESLGGNNKHTQAQAAISLSTPTKESVINPTTITEE